MILTVTLNPAIDKLYVVDALAPYTVMRVREVCATAGGKGLNVSRVAALSGERVTAMGFAGGHNGALFESLICEPTIEKAFTHIVAATRTCINVRDTQTNKSTEFLEPGSPVSREELQVFLTDFKRRLAQADVVTISGSMPAGTPVDFYAELICLAKEQGKPVLLDTSGAALKAAVQQNPAWVKPNTDEVRDILAVDIENRAQLIAAARQLHEQGVAHVAVSMGKEGVLVVCAQGVFHGVTPDIPVVNTVGCGDSMLAGFAVGTARGWSVEETIRYGVAVSTANALTKETGSFRQEDLETVLPLIEVRRVQG